MAKLYLPYGDKQGNRKISMHTDLHDSKSDLHTLLLNNLLW